MTKAFKIVIRIYCLFFLLGNAVSAQSLLTQTDAIEAALSNNYGIQLAKSNVQIAKNNTSKKLNGYTPSVDVQAGATYDLGGINQKSPVFGNLNVQNVSTLNANASVQGNYTLIDKARGLTLQQLKEELNLSNLELRNTMETNVYQLLSTYYQIAQLSKNKDLLAQTLQVSKRRLLRKQYQFEYGQDNKLGVLNAEVDIQRDSVNYLNLIQQIDNAKRNLNVILNRDINTVFDVDTSVVYDPTLNLQQLIEDTKKNNVNIALINKNAEIINYNFDIIDAGAKPTLNAQGSYSLAFQNSPKNNITFSHNRGLSLGLNAAWNIFDGGRRKMQKENTQVSLEIQGLQKQQLEQQLERDVINTWANYQNSLYIVQVEKSNVATNEINFQRTEEQFKAGQISSVEFRQAQLNLLNAATSYNVARYDALLAELELRRLSGKLLE